MTIRPILCMLSFIGYIGIRIYHSTWHGMHYARSVPRMQKSRSRTATSRVTSAGEAITNRT